ncbi:hypothetical protein L873DRAFT_1787778 [Choiromyces venosus 120613-1]|uniref:Uncharacterized protein n=1 Tax=Choiromyces venosus 120613-1 TaxID=1336337 RepID=A0A3N4JYT3_9PEZI|nr:hypothetical protein L873DRAFT_1787778 [Choiromyces venosus 120613-1]
MFKILKPRCSSSQQNTERKLANASIDDSASSQRASERKRAYASIDDESSSPPQLPPPTSTPRDPSPIPLPVKALLRDSVSQVTRVQKLVDLDGVKAVQFRDPEEEI